MSTTSIKFGTSGWRALYHHDFTYENVGIVLQAIAEEVKRGPQSANGVAVGYDVRFMGRRFAEWACEVLAGNGIRTYLMKRDLPTPTLSFTIRDRELAGGVNFTASHNPFEYNGVKYSPETGGPAMPEVTSRIETRIAELQLGGAVNRMDYERAKKEKFVEEIDPAPAYFEALEKLVRVEAFQKLKGRRVAVDCKFAVARGYLDKFLEKHGVDVTVINGKADPYFGGEHPEPGAGHVAALEEYMRADEKAVVGLACDGDADRFGIVDADGTFFEANLVLALLLNYLAPARGWTTCIARSLATTHLLDKVAEKHKLRVHETPVGFKYIGDLLVRGEIVFGAEESAGLTIEHHLPEKDGILAGLLVTEMLATTGKTLAQLRDALYAEVGNIFDKRTAVKLNPDMEASYPDRVGNPPKKIAGKAVVKTDTTDGTKLYLEDDEWVLLRKSGTEPVVRLYAEATQPKRLDDLIDGCRKWLEG